MKKILKGFSVIVTIMLVMGLLGACGKKTDTSQTSDTSESNTDTKDVASEPIEIEMFTRFADGASKDFFDKVAADYTSKNPNVKVVVTSADNENYKQEINVRLASNDAPDIYFAWSAVYAKNFVDGGRALDLTSYINDDKEWSDKIMTSQFGPYTFNNNIYGIPIIMDGKTFYYNKDIFNELGLEVPENWDEFMTVLDTLSKTDYIPISLGNIDDWATGHYITTLNQRVVPADVLQKDYNLDGDFSDAAYVEALEYLNQLVPYFTPEFNSVSYDTGINDFITGKAAIYYEQFNQVQYIEPAEFEWSWFDFPDIEGAKGDQNALTGAPQGFMVSAETKYPEECVAFLKYLTTPEVAGQMVKDTMMISTVDGAINETTANENLIKIADTIKQASSINVWLDNSTDSEVVSIYLSGIQAMVGGSKTPQEVMADVQKMVQTVKNSK
ncbi:MAG: extracellular solute-binding protein [Herbinix sp.]|nr:extracellular solute-binding protein [Herbinix sp.]